jgi:transcriptional regulator with XRE-family HTH domain
MKHPTLIAFGKNLRRLRLLQKLSQEDLAEIAALHRNTIGQIERAELNISLLAIAAIAKALRIKPAVLLKGL